MDELGAHVSAQGGPDRAPARAAELDTVVCQIFTKQPNRWAEPSFSAEQGEAFRAARREYGIQCVASHDSYLINLSSPKEDLWARSLDSFTRELERCAVLGLEFVVTHPGNATDGELEEGCLRNALGVTHGLREVEPGTKVLLEITAGSGTSVGGSFEGLARILEALGDDVADRVGVCFDTCHAYSAGYDLVNDYDRVWDDFDRLIGLERLGLFHLNDSQHPFDSHKDRHEAIGEGSLGQEPFRRIMRDNRFRHVPKVLETPKGDDGVSADRANLARLRSYRD
jgi:deoxyribonuclease-4